MAMDTGVDLQRAEERLNIRFEDKTLLSIALTHSSFANQKKHVKFNERLEYLGDAVLELIITEYLFKTFRLKHEGELTKLRAIIVCESSLHEVAYSLGLGDFIAMSKGEESTGGRERASILADCMEAVIAAIYLDKGIEVTREFILSNFIEIINNAVKRKIFMDYKTKFQEVVQKKNEHVIEYKLISIEGPAHRPIFNVELIFKNEVYGEGTGNTKKEAEQNAARKGLERLKYNKLKHSSIERGAGNE